MMLPDYVDAIAALAEARRKRDLVRKRHRTAVSELRESSIALKQADALVRECAADTRRVD